VNALQIRDVVAAVFVSLMLVFMSVELQGRVGLGLDDEGFLWYGVQKLIEGDVPLRDFQSYDPGRYLWGGLSGSVFGEGILGLRAGVAVFQFLGLACGLFVLCRMTSSIPAIFAAALLLLLWMFPRHKLFEPSIAMGAVFFGTLLLKSPTIVRHLLAGIFVGIAAFFGRNHGLYCLAGLGGMAFFLFLRNGFNASMRRILSLGLGILLGLSPFAAMMYLFPDFGTALAESLSFHFATGSVNLSLPVPWPWLVDLTGIKEGVTFRLLAHGILLVGIPIFYFAVLLKGFVSKGTDMGRMAPLVSSAFVGIPYLHHAFARADLSHLAQAIHPFLIGVLCLPVFAKGRLSKLGSYLALAVVAVLTLGSAVTVSPAYEKWISKPEPYARIKVQGDDLWVPRATADLVNGLFSMERRYFSQGGEVMAAPHLPGAYALLGRKAPVWQTYFFFPETEERQKDMIQDMDRKGVRWLILGSGTLDGREDLRFRNTHPLVWRHIMDAFEPVPGETLPGGYQLFRRRVL